MFMCGILKNWKRKGGKTFFSCFLNNSLFSNENPTHFLGWSMWFRLLISLYPSWFSLSLGKKPNLTKQNQTVLKFPAGIVSFKIFIFIWIVLLLILEAFSLQHLVCLFLSLLKDVGEMSFMPRNSGTVKCLGTFGTDCYWLWSNRKGIVIYFWKRKGDDDLTFELTKLRKLNQIWKYILSQNSHQFKNHLECERDNWEQRLCFSQS